MPLRLPTCRKATSTPEPPACTPSLVPTGPDTASRPAISPPAPTSSTRPRATRRLPRRAVPIRSTASSPFPGLSSTSGLGDVTRRLSACTSAATMAARRLTVP
ncbi:hypothetical protein VTJ49DRAFT_1245 [Mycothermus thermophilus]|uniref:Uncharacterized protein n=1 Tax=Humicola insolens TaxID=85995 RepID=A0ABR3VDH5_HUMIN